jgi:glycosyltransferase involved in cell wall biosynthesis
MRVLVFTTTYPNPAQPTHGVFVQERLCRLARFADLRVVAPYPWWYRGPVAKREERAGLEVHHPTFWYVPRFLKFLDAFFLFLSSLSCVTRLRRNFDFDLIDAHFLYPDGVAAALLGWWFKRPVVITSRGTLPGHLARPLHRVLMRRAAAWAATVIAVSHNLADMILQLGVAVAKVEVIPNGVDTERFRPLDKREVRQQLNIPAACRLLVSVGHLSPRKGFQRVLRVLPELVSEFPDLKFVIVGGPAVVGNNAPELYRLTRELGLGEHVFLAGAKQPDEVALYLNAADLFVLATDFEGCPNVVNEALACGVPVVVSRVGEVDRMVPEGCGLLVDDPHDLPQLRHQLQEGLRHFWDRSAIRRAVEGRTWDAVAERVVEQWQRAKVRPSRQDRWEAKAMGMW